jgi:predicted RNA-binding protein with PIN domain
LLVVVDAMNVIGSRPDGWWRDRPGAQRRLYRQLEELAPPDATGVVVVYEGEPLPDLGGGAVTVRWARRRGRDAADDRIVEEVAEARAAGHPVVVVTADRGLRDRVTALGARCVGPHQLQRAVSGQI